MAPFFSSSTSLFILLPLTTFLLLLPPSSSSPQIGFRASLTRLHHAENLTKLQLIRRSLQQSRCRLKRFIRLATSAPSDGFQSPISVGDGEFLMNLSIGTPPIPLPAVMDTGSDLIWTQCNPCTKCFHQVTPLFNPAKSSTFSNISCSSELCKDASVFKCGNGCEYLYTYGDESSTQGFMATETLTFDDSANNPVSIPNLGLGCGVNNDGSGFGQGSGLVGLGRGPLSLVSQLGLTKFSYCLTSIGEKKTSSVLFGSLADLNYSISNIGATHSTSTPLIQNPNEPSFYYLSLQGITVGETLLSIPKTVFKLQKDGSGGMIIDSGTTLTMIQEDAFNVLRKEFVSQMTLRVSDRTDDTGLDLCFDLPTEDVDEIRIPKLKLHFEGLDLQLPPENYMISDSREGLVCLAMEASDEMSIFGNIQQQNYLVLHDLEKETVSFFPTQCDQL